ncbi:MAG TPA: hypothetical protein VMS08_01935 [Candidatus Saccharimonadia bacterium]|nr:hypothetical protein [Candidatus Saccharimonadia bacterium]
MSDTPKKLVPAWIRGTFITAACLMAIAIGDTLFHSQVVYAQLESWKLIPTPQHFTELYFENNQSLPTTIPTKPVAFDFAIGDHDGQLVTYPYEVVITTQSGVTSEVDAGQVALPDGQTASIPVLLTLPKGTTTAEIYVELPDQKQVIDFRMGAAQ